jgi:hypothetical protein
VNQNNFQFSTTNTAEIVENSSTRAEGYESWSMTGAGSKVNSENSYTPSIIQSVFSEVMRAEAVLVESKAFALGPPE